MSQRAKKKVNLALQGGGAHGAFTWGVLDRMLEEEAVEIDGISATSAGAMNAAVYKMGWINGGADGAKALLERFWRTVSDRSPTKNSPLLDFISATYPMGHALATAERSATSFAADTFSRMFSPYQFNPMNINPLRDLLNEIIDFPRIAATKGPQMFINATNVRTGRIKVFSGAEVTVDAVLASATLPTLFQAVEIHGEAYWDGGYMGNPALFPLVSSCRSVDIIIVHINPMDRPKVPKTATEILNRVNEVSFNSSLMRELRAIDFVQRLIKQGQVEPDEKKHMLIHSVRDDETMRALGASSKMCPDWSMLTDLKEAGRTAMDTWLRTHWADVGVRNSIDLTAIFN